MNISQILDFIAFYKTSQISGIGVVDVQIKNLSPAKTLYVKQDTNVINSFKLRLALFVTYTIIQSITSNEMCSLHLTHPSAHLEQWAADNAAPGEQLGVWCLAQGSHLSRGQFLPEPRFEPTTSGYKSNTLIH